MKQPERELKDYRAQTQNKLKKLLPIFAKAAIGDFSRNVNIPQQEDDFTDLYVGLQIMIEVIREQKAELEAANRRLRQTVAERTTDLREVAAEKAKRDAILNSVGEGLVVTDRDHRIVLANKTAFDMLRCGPQQLVGQVWPRVIKIYDANRKPLTRKQTAFIMSQQKKRRVTLRHEYFTRFDGKVVPVSVTAAPVIIDKRVEAAVTVFRDISKELEIEQARQEFTALASHQLRTPVSIIKWYSQILASHSANLTANQQKYLTEINLANDRMNRLIKSLLDIARVETGKYLVEPADLNLSEYVSEIVGEMKPQAALKAVKIREQYPAKPLDIEADPKVVRVVVENLLSNAIKFSSSKGMVTIKVCQQAADSELGGQAIKRPSAVVMVKDQGQGILKAQQAQIFKHMFNPAQQGGSGLGLYLTKAVVKRAGGQLWFTSRAGKGSSFFASFPLEA